MSWQLLEMMVVLSTPIISKMVVIIVTICTTLAAVVRNIGKDISSSLFYNNC